MTGSIIHHRKALAADLSRNGGGKMGLTQSRTAEKQQIGRPFSEIMGILYTGIVHPLHMLPCGLGLTRRPLIRIPVRVEGVKALAAQIQQLGKLLALLLHIVYLQAPADLAAPVAGIAAQGTQRRFLQSRLRQPQLRQQGFPLRLQIEILFLQALDLRQRVLPPPQSRRQNPAGGAAQLLVDLPQAGAAGIDGLPAGSLLRFPDAAVSFIPFLRQTQKPSIV